MLSPGLVFQRRKFALHAREQFGELLAEDVARELIDAAERPLIVAGGETSGAVVQALDVPQERRFVGFDAYQKVLAAGPDLVILATFADMTREEARAYVPKVVRVDARNRADESEQASAFLENHRPEESPRMLARRCDAREDLLLARGAEAGEVARIFLNGIRG